MDDAWGLVAFSVALAIADVMVGQNGMGNAFADGARDLLGGVFLGIVIGVPMAYLTGRVHKGEPTQSEALGMVLLCGGLALWMHVSFLLSAMVMGLVVAHLAKHHRRPFHAIEGIEWPFIVVFFVLAGASLSLDEIGKGGWLLVGYLVFRLFGRIVGATLGGRLARMPAVQGRWLGLTLLPQAGVALGMTMVGIQRFPEIAATVLPVVLAATVVFEVVGPVLTRAGLEAVGETSSGNDDNH
jgi:Kef-type K+ transport system membrane component KefB